MARSKPLAELVDKALGDLLARRGFAGSEIVLAWPDIVGEALAARSRPERIVWPRQREAAGGGTLVVRVVPGFALDLQYLTPVVLERIATYFGWRAVERLRIEQGRLPASPEPRPKRPPVSPESRARALAAVTGIEHDDLRAALVRLGAAALADPGRSSK